MASGTAARDAQYDAMLEWGIPDRGALQRLTGIQAPTFIIHGDNDLMIPTKLSHLLAVDAVENAVSGVRCERR
jgi:hypothetical protein